MAFCYTVPSIFTADFIGLDSVTIAAVPEPQATLLMLLGLAGVGAAVRRRAP